MRLFHDILDRDNHLGGRNRITRNRRRRHNKSVTRKSKMTRRKGRGKGKARAMSMLKSAKQRFYGGQSYSGYGSYEGGQTNYRLTGVDGVQ